MQQVLRKKRQKLRKQQISLNSQRNSQTQVLEYQRVYLWQALRVQVKHYLQRLFQVRQMFHFSLFPVQTLQKCLLVLVHQGFVTFLNRQRKMLLVLYLLMKLMQQVVGVVLVQVVATMKENRHLISSLQKWTVLA